MSDNKPEESHVIDRIDSVILKPENEKIDTTWPYMTIKSFGSALLMKIAAIWAIWGWGYMHWSVAWLLPPVIYSVWKYESGKSDELKRLTAQATAMANEKDIITNKMNDLPSWVYFPDFDRVEWLNKVLFKIWPGMNHFVRNLVRESIKPAIVKALSDYKLPGFQFERLVLGRIPPKVYGIKTYDKNTSRNEIIIDCEVLYAGDCDISFTLGNIKGGIRDFQLRGMLRIVMKPMLTIMPLIGGVQIFFLNNPELDFNLVGAADVLDFPGLKQALRKVIKEQFANVLVLPNKLVIPLTEDIPTETLKMPEPEGVLRIHVVQAKHLMKKDISVLGKGKSDPYAIISVGSQEFRTKTIDNTVDPKWDYWCECIVSSAIGQQLGISLWDLDDTKEDESLGRATIEVSRVKEKGVIDTWFTLEFAKHGMVHLRLTWLSLSKNVADLQAAIIETQKLRVTSMSTALLTVFIDSAKNLPCLRGSKQPDVYLEASVGNKTERTSTMLRSCDPIWEQGFTFLVGNPETNTLNVKIVDEKTTTIVGTLVYNISNLMTKTDLEEMQQPYDLQSTESDSKVIMSLSLRLLKYEAPEGSPAQDDDDELDINELKKRMERQESNISGSQSSSLPSTPLKKQLSKESLPNVVSNPDTAISPPDTVDEEMLEDTISARYYADTESLLHRNPSIMSSAGEYRLGRIQLTIRYSVPRQKLVVVVHKIANLPLPQNDPNNIPDPYVKLYLLPDKHKETKRKTAVIKDNCNPVYDEQFEYVVAQADLNSRVLEISVCTQKGWLSTGSNVMGQVHLNLAEMDITRATSAWYDLVPEIRD